MRDRLIELFKEMDENPEITCPHPGDDDLDSCKGCRYAIGKNGWLCDLNARKVDHLLANGVIVPPCKVGDTMYKVCTVNSAIKMGQLWDGNVVKANCDRCGYRNCHCYDIGLRKHDPDTMIDVIVPRTISSVEFLVRIMPYVGTVWFNTKEEAEAKIKEGKQ